MGGRYGHWIGTRIMPEMAARFFFFAACRSPIPYILGFCKRLNCKSPHGLVYSGIYFVRCQNGNDDELTENITITALSPNFEKIFTVSGYEFAPIKTERKLTFWGIKQGSTHEVIEIKIKNWRIEAPFVRAIRPA